MSTSDLIYSDLISWSRETLYLWQQDAFRRLFEKSRLDANDLEVILKLCISGNGIPVEGELLQPAILQSISPHSINISENVVLKKISNVSNVNALANNQTLIFQENGITIVYGGNGTGKSGYARILKKVCRARADSEILQNIYEDTRNPPCARVNYLVGTNSVEYDWQLNAPVPALLNHISIFDSSCAEVHIDRSNDVAYTPKALDILGQLAQVSREIKDILERHKAAIESNIPDFIRNNKSREFTTTGELIHLLNRNTDLSHIERMTNITKDEHDKLKDIRDILQKDPVTHIERLNVIKNKLVVLMQYVENSYNNLNTESVKSLKLLYVNAAEKEKASSVAADILFKDEPLAGVGTEIWEKLWESARRYSNIVYINKTFPVTEQNSRCLLCQQQLSEEAINRFVKFEEFIKKDLQRESSLAKQRLFEKIQALNALHIDREHIRDYYNLLKIDLGEKELATYTRKYLISICLSLNNINKAKNSEDIIEYDLDETLRDALSRLLSKIIQQIEIIKKSLDSEGRRRLETEQAEIEDRIWISKHKNALLDEVERLKLLHKYQLSINETDTRNISLKSTEIANILITNALRDRFTQELNDLGINHLRAELIRDRSQYGIPKFKVQLIRNPSAHIGNVLSEGEYRSIAIAAFLAELSTAEHKSGMIFDDPVCSLDHNYRQKIANRLVREAAQRQVVIFTHDISFVFMIQTSAKSENIPVFYQAIDKSRINCGVCQSKPPFHILPVSEALDLLLKYLNQVKALHENGKIEEWTQKVDSLSIRLRKCWELAIEKAMSPVFTRFSYKVDTRGLIKLSVLTEDDCQIMRERYGVISQWEHSESSAIGNPIPTPTDVLQEIQILRDWFISIESRQEAVNVV